MGWKQRFEGIDETEKTGMKEFDINEKERGIGDVCSLSSNHKKGCRIES